MRQRPVYTLEQIVDIFQLEVPVLRPRDLYKKRNSWCAYLGYDTTKKRSIEIYASGKYTRSEAFQRMQPRILAYLQGRMPQMVTFDGYACKWMQTLTCRISTKKWYEAIVQNHLIPYFGSKKLQKITASEIKQYIIEKRAATNLTNKTLNDHLLILRIIFKAAVEDQLLTINPAKIVKKMRQTKSEVEAFSQEEAIKILDAARQHFSKFYAPLLHAFTTGERAGEIWGHKWDDIEEGKIKVERSISERIVGPTKDSECRKIDFPKQLRKALAESSMYYSKLKSEWLYCNDNGKPICHRNFFKRVWKPLLKKAEVPHKKFHCIRHTFASLHLQQGTSLEWISRTLGHSALDFTFKTYVHFLPKADEGAANRLAESIGG